MEHRETQGMRAKTGLKLENKMQKVGKTGNNMSQCLVEIPSM